MGKELVASHYPAVQQLRFRCAASATAHFHARLEKTSPSVQCVSRGHSPYEKTTKHNSLCEQAPNGVILGFFFALLIAGAKISLAEWGFLM